MKIFKIILAVIFIFLIIPKTTTLALPTALGEIPTDPGEIANKIFQVGIGLGGGVALIMMIIAAYRIIGSRGNPDAIQGGRELFTSAIIGLLFIIFAVVILQLIGRDIIGIPNFGLNFHNNVYAASFGGYQISDPAGLKGNLTSIGSVLSAFLPAVFGLAGMVAMIFIVMGGFKYLTSRGDPKALDGARSTITSAIVGLVIIIGLFVILQIIAAVFNIRVTALVPTVYADTDLGSAFTFGGAGAMTLFPSFGKLVSNFLAVVFPLAGIVFFIMLLWGGIKYMLTRGDDKAKMAARNIITSAIIGLLIIIGSFLIIKVVEGITGVSTSIIQ